MLEMAPLLIRRAHHSVCVLTQNQLVVSGTRHPSNHSSKVELYDCLSNTWRSLASLRVGRYWHSSCALQSQVFVFCGMDSNANKLSSIEFLSLDTTLEWQSIDASILGERIAPSVHSVSQGQIVILGGNDKHWNFKSDCHLFDTRTNHIKQVALHNNLGIASGPIQVFK